MYRVDLDVPFSDKDQVKQLGARWDSDWKVWYVPAGIDALNLKEWFPKVEDGRVRAQYFYSLTTMIDCWKCKKSTRVHGICLPPEHEKYQIVEQASEVNIGTWLPQGNATVLSYLDNVSDTVKTMISELSIHYKYAYSKQKKQWYFMNHCSHCGIKISDHELHGEQGNPFYFPTVAEGMSIILRRHNKLFDGTAVGGWWTYLNDYVSALESHLHKK